MTRILLVAANRSPSATRDSGILSAMARWLGVDVGGERKGHDVAVIDDHRLLALAGGFAGPAVIELVEQHRPTVIAIDSPRSCAPAGEPTRECERRLNRSICGIRWTPDRERVDAGGYYGWIREGLALFDALSGAAAELIEVFPTASWTRWFGERGVASRARWSSNGLARLGLEELPDRTNQDQRDAIAAAVTARQHSLAMTRASARSSYRLAPVHAS